MRWSVLIFGRPISHFPEDLYLRSLYEYLLIDFRCIRFSMFLIFSYFSNYVFVFCLLIFSLLILSLNVTPNIGLKNRICAASSFRFSLDLSTQVSLPYFRADLGIILIVSPSFRIYLPKCLYIGLYPFNLLIFISFLLNLD